MFDNLRKKFTNKIKWIYIVLNAKSLQAKITILKQKEILVFIVILLNVVLNVVLKFEKYWQSD